MNRKQQSIFVNVSKRTTLYLLKWEVDRKDAQNVNEELCEKFNVSVEELQKNRFLLTSHRNLQFFLTSALHCKLKKLPRVNRL